jgi:hypothetical protein
VRREVAAAHARQIAAFQTTTTTAAAAASSFPATGKNSECAPAAELESALGQLLALQTAGQGVDYGAQASGGKVGLKKARVSR